MDFKPRHWVTLWSLLLSFLLIGLNSIPAWYYAFEAKRGYSEVSFNGIRCIITKSSEDVYCPTLPIK